MSFKVVRDQLLVLAKHLDNNSQIISDALWVSAVKFQLVVRWQYLLKGRALRQF